MSLFTKIFVAFLVIILALSGASLIAFSDTFRDLYKQTLTDDLKKLAITLRDDIPAPVDPGTAAKLDRYVKELGRQLRTRITVVDPKGRVAADSDEDTRHMENHSNRPEIIAALSGQVGSSTRYSSTMNQEVLYVALPLQEDGTVTGAVRVGLFVKDISFPPGLTRRMAVITSLLALAGLFAAFLIARSISRPIKDLTEAARRLAGRDFTARIFLKRNDEVKALGDTFNFMADEIKTGFDEIAKQRSELESIIESLREGLVVIDQKDIVVRSNKSLRTIFELETAPEGELYWEVLREPQFLQLMDRAKSGKHSFTDEAEINGKTFVSSVTVLPKEKEAVVVFHDITPLKEVERVKRDLVANLSHELRTPLTSIKGFAETLEETADEENRRYAEIIRKNTDRLISMVQDLLLLSQLEETHRLQETESVDLRKLVEDTVRIFENAIKEKNLTVELALPADVPHIQGDAFKIEQMLVNLLDNAIKYTDTGGIRIALKHERDSVVIEVDDTGIGIPRDKLSRIFERFYVVDKSRSRKMGGTGLGLSIVKHIVLLHGGNVNVDSTVGKGSHFLVRLPLRPA
jgi:two-component system phosphate regulon sensor histidine kinase PhoR